MAILSSKSLSVEGLARVLANLRATHSGMGERCEQGLKRAGLFLQRESQKRCPVDTGNLKASAFTRAVGKGWKTAVFVGYTAAYALFVHEKVDMKLKGVRRSSSRGRYWDPQGRAQAKFLEAPAREKKQEIFAIVRGALS